MKKRIVITHEENKNLGILIALTKIRDYSDMEFEQIGTLTTLFRQKKDIYYDVPSDIFPALLNDLERSGFVYKLIEIPD